MQIYCYTQKKTFTTPDIDTDRHQRSKIYFLPRKSLTALANTSGLI